MKTYKYEYVFAVMICQARTAKEMLWAYQDLETQLECAVGRALFSKFQRITFADLLP